MIYGSDTIENDGKSSVVNQRSVSHVICLTIYNISIHKIIHEIIFLFANINVYHGITTKFVLQYKLIKKMKGTEAIFLHALCALLSDKMSWLLFSNNIVADAL